MHGQVCHHTLARLFRVLFWKRRAALRGPLLGELTMKTLLCLSLAAALVGSSLVQASAETKPKKEPTAAQLLARERQKQCGAEWQTAKAAKTLTANATWPKFWSECSARLKAKETEKRA